jgi:hypothetical protein
MKTDLSISDEVDELVQLVTSAAVYSEHALAAIGQCVKTDWYVELRVAADNDDATLELIMDSSQDEYS